MAAARTKIANAFAVSDGKIEQLTTQLTDAIAAASQEIFGEHVLADVIVEALVRNLADMVASNETLDTPQKVDSYCRHVGFDLASYALTIRGEGRLQ
jgi:hypothetical protein